MVWDYNDFAFKLWKNDPDLRKDHLRWHRSGHHIETKSITVYNAIEDAHECLESADPLECGINIPEDDWERVQNLSPMIIAMAKLLWQKLKGYGRYAFIQEPDWEKAAKEYLHDLDL